ncbi:hypothetical protein BDW75DRAFT_97915 [Aspergillus navahoensis]
MAKHEFKTHHALTKMEFADVKLFADMLLDACEAAEKAGKPMLDTCFLLDKGKETKQDMTRIAKGLFRRLQPDFSTLSGSGSVQDPLTAYSPWLSPDLNELTTWFRSLCDKGEKTVQDRVRERYYSLLFLIKNLCDHYTCDGFQTLTDMIFTSGNLHRELIPERFASANAVIIQEAPLQVYSAALVFCPQKSLSKGFYWDQRFNFIKRVYVMQESWDPCIQVLEGHEDKVSAVPFSPDG